VNKPRRTLRLTASALAVVASLGVVTASPASAAAGVRAAAAASCDVATVKTRVEAAIDRRLVTLDKLAHRVDTAKGLTSSDRSTLASQIAAEKTGLTSLRGHVAADADCPSLRTDAKSVVDDYRVYLVMEPKVHLVISADSITAVTNSDKISDAIAKLQDGIDKKQAQGKDVTQAQAHLDDMKAKVAAAKAAVANVTSSVIGLQPADYPGNRATIVAGRDSVRAGRTDLRAARADGRAVIADLRAS
jgi:hypothetical protein